MESKRREAVSNVEEKHKLIEQWTPLVYARVRNLRRRYAQLRRLDRNDIFQEGQLGLIRASQLWDETRISDITGQPIKFVTYAQKSIDSSIIRLISKELFISGMKRLADGGMKKALAKTNLRKNVEAVFAGPMPLDTRLEFVEDWLGLMDSTEEAVAQTEEAKALVEKVNRLPKPWSTIARMRWLEEKSQQEIGNVLGLTKERVRQLEPIALRRLQRMYGLTPHRTCFCGRQLEYGYPYRSCEKCRIKGRKH
jgi:RNA polymerase sigma factor (sigma-70 family)